MSHSSTTAVLAALLLTAGCAGPQQREKPAKKPEPPSPPAQAMLEGGPKHFVHEGEIFVVTTRAGADDFAARKALASCVTHEFAGPHGETVYVESSEDDAELAARVWLEWSKENVEYHERERDGRIYVVGSAASLAKFEKTGHLEITRTLIGEGPEGETVVLEVDKKHPFLVERLHRSFQARRK